MLVCLIQQEESLVDSEQRISIVAKLACNSSTKEFLGLFKLFSNMNISEMRTLH